MFESNRFKSAVPGDGLFLLQDFVAMLFTWSDAQYVGIPEKEKYNITAVPQYHVPPYIFWPGGQYILHSEIYLPPARHQHDPL